MVVYVQFWNMTMVVKLIKNVPKAQQGPIWRQTGLKMGRLRYEQADDTQPTCVIVNLRRDKGR